MLKLNEFLSRLEKYAPLKLSELCIEKGDYDNSGIIVNSHDDVKRVLFSLDLSAKSVREAVKRKCDTVVTHHPAIYRPVKTLSVEDADIAPVLQCVKRGVNVISMHLNLDCAVNGIDDKLREALMGGEYRILENLDGAGAGYGREFKVDGARFGGNLASYVKAIKNNLKTRKILYYGNPQAKIETVASFCGGGYGHAEDYLKGGGKPDAVVTSDIPHHVIKEGVERGVAVICVPHYCAEEYGFHKFSESVAADSVGSIDAEYFCDGRFF